MPAHVLHGPHAHPVTPEVLGARRHAGVLEFEAGTEGPSGAGQDHHPTVVVGGHLVEGGVEVGDQGEGQRIEPGRIVQGDQPGRGGGPGRGVTRAMPPASPNRTAGATRLPDWAIIVGCRWNRSAPSSPTAEPTRPSAWSGHLLVAAPGWTIPTSPAGWCWSSTTGTTGPSGWSSTGPAGWRWASCCPSGRSWPPRRPSCSPVVRWPATP